MICVQFVGWAGKKINNGYCGTFFILLTLFNNRLCIYDILPFIKQRKVVFIQNLHLIRFSTFFTFVQNQKKISNTSYYHFWNTFDLHYSTYYYQDCVINNACICAKNIVWKYKKYIVFFLNVFCVFVFYVFLCCSVCWFLYGPFCHGAL